MTKTEDFNSGRKWSPDGSTSAFNRIGAGGSLDVSRMDANGSKMADSSHCAGTVEAFAAW